MLTGELVPVDWHGLPVQVTNGPDRSSEVLFVSGSCGHQAENGESTCSAEWPRIGRCASTLCIGAMVKQRAVGQGTDRTV